MDRQTNNKVTCDEKWSLFYAFEVRKFRNPKKLLWDVEAIKMLFLLVF